MYNNGNIMKQLAKQQQGAASIFIVIFFALLISVITLSFIKIVNTGQEESRNSDLSKSAYDSASAGVEDAKRALNLYYQKNCLKDPTGDPDCGVIAAQFDKKDCSALSNLKDQLGLTVDTAPEVQVKQNSNDQQYNQAYTCANLDFKTDDYVRQIAAGNSDLIPLKGTGDFNLIKLQWFRAEDASSPNDDFTLRSDSTLPVSDSIWGGNTPSLMRVELIPFNSGDNASSINNNSRAVFLVPAQSGVDPSSDNITFEANDTGRKGPKPLQPILVKCNTSTEYACTANLKLAVPSDLQGYYLKVTPLYNQSTFRLSLYYNAVDANVVQFNGVEPSVDITGRADDVFRRVITRLAPNDLTQKGLTNLSFDSETGICKTFYFGLEYSDNPSLPCTNK